MIQIDGQIHLKILFQNHPSTFRYAKRAFEPAAASLSARRLG